MAKMGRPKIEIDKTQFEKLCAIFCTEREIASFFGCSIDTVNRWCISEYGQTFADTYEQKAVHGKISLRRLQFQACQKLNPTMLVWMGKVALGQQEPPQRVEGIDRIEEIMRKLDEDATNRKTE